MKKLILIALILLAFKSNSQTKVIKHYSNGLVMEIGFIKNDKCDSTWIKFNEEGNIISKAFYKEGMKIGTWEIVTDVNIFQIVYVDGKKAKYTELNFKREIVKSINY